MKTIGLIGGMSWESTIPYYRIINEEINNRLGGLHSARIILYSVEFDEIEKCQSNNEWEKSGEILGNAAKGIEAAGADFLAFPDAPEPYAPVARGAGADRRHRIYGRSSQTL